VPVQILVSLLDSGHAIQEFAPPYPKTKPAFRSQSPGITSVPVSYPMLPVAGHRSAGGTSLKENYPTLAWSLHRKNASQSGQDPCLLSRKRKKRHHQQVQKGMASALADRLAGLGCATASFDCHRAWQLLVLDNIEPASSPKSSMGKFGDGEKLRREELSRVEPLRGVGQRHNFV
jgi:hypothetical protein